MLGPFVVFFIFIFKEGPFVFLWVIYLHQHIW